MINSVICHFLFLISRQIEPDSDISFRSMNRPPYHGRVKTVAPRIGSVDNRILLFKISQVFAPDVYRPAAEVACHLGAELAEAFVACIPRRGSVGKCVRIGHTSSPVHLPCGIKLPQTQRSLIRGSDEAFIFSRQGLLHQLMIIGSLRVCPAICGSQRESLKEGISGLHLKYL